MCKLVICLFLSYKDISLHFSNYFRLGSDQSNILIQKLECMFPDDKKVYTSKIDLRNAKKHNTKVKEIRVKLFRNIWQQSEY